MKQSTTPAQRSKNLAEFLDWANRLNDDEIDLLAAWAAGPDAKSRHERRTAGMQYKRNWSIADQSRFAKAMERCYVVPRYLHSHAHDPEKPDIRPLLALVRAAAVAAHDSNSPRELQAAFAALKTLISGVRAAGGDATLIATTLAADWKSDAENLVATATALSEP